MERDRLQIEADSRHGGGLALDADSWTRAIRRHLANRVGVGRGELLKVP